MASEEGLPVGSAAHHLAPHEVAGLALDGTWRDVVAGKWRSHVGRVLPVRDVDVPLDGR